MRIGYARCSSTGQNLDSQIENLSRFCTDIRQEKVSGTSLDGREELKTLLKELSPGDELYVVRLDRLARSLRDLIDIADTIQKAGASLHVTEQNIETKTAAGRLFFNMLGAFSAFETEIRRERQMAGIELAKKRGAYKRTGSRTPKFDRAHIAELRRGGLRIEEIAATVGCAAYTVRRALKGVSQ